MRWEKGNIFYIDKGKISDFTEFIRDPEFNKTHLHHICKREPKKEEIELQLGRVIFDFILGHYYCSECKKKCDPKIVWSDGIGTGYESEA